MKRRALLTIAALALAAPQPQVALAQNVEHERAKIVSIDLNNSKVELLDTKGRTFMRAFAKDATVKFTDGARFFPNPSVRDLRPPMYVHYMFVADVIQQFDVVELGYDPSTAQKQAEPAPAKDAANSAEGRVVKVSRQAVVIEVAGRQESYGVAQPGLLKKLVVGTTARFSWIDRGGRRVITEIR